MTQIYSAGVAPPDDIHRVANTGDSVANTLHVYGADLSQATTSDARLIAAYQASLTAFRALRAA